jgi:DNA-binding NtrC family response regulator
VSVHRARVLVVDDDRAVRSALSVNLSKGGLDVTLATSSEEALALLHEAAFDLVLTDVRMPGETGIALLGSIRASWPDTPVIVMTGYGSVEDAVTAMKGGAADYLIKPVARDELLVVLDRALETRALRAELVALRREVEKKYGFENLIGTTPGMIVLYEHITAVADSSATILLHGETGTGKELFAHAVHYRSGRARGPFVRINCAAIPDTLLESELFGHEKGAFTGAVRQHAGRFEQADGGTLLLDEIGDIGPLMQVKLLRVLESGEVSRLGGREPRKVDVRVIAATHRDLQAEVAAGRFRADLFYRLNVFTLRIPPLRQRKADIPLLADFFVRRYAERNRRPVPRLHRSVLDQLVAYPWPGNVRELEHIIERAVILCRDDELRSVELPTQDAAPAPEPEPVEGTLKDLLAAYERRVIVAALEACDGVQARAAKRLGLSRSNLNYRIMKLDINRTDVSYD